MSTGGAGGSAVSDPREPSEREADVLADAALSGGESQAGTDLYGVRLAASLPGVRIHTDPVAAASAQALGALAYTVGRDVVFAPNQFAPQTRAGSRLLAHELAHVVQQQRPESATRGRINRQVAPPAPGGQCKLPPQSVINQQVAPPAPGGQCVLPPQNVGTFVLDPALSVSAPPSMTTYVRVVDPWAAGPAPPRQRYVDIERQVLSASVVKVLAIRLQDVFDNPLEASSTIYSQAVRVLPTLQEGDRAWTARGQFTVTGVRGDIVFSDTPVPEAAGAGSIILAQTDAGSVLIDSGQQLRDPSVAGPVGEEIARRLLLLMPVGAVDEAVLMPGAPSGHSLPVIATHFGITNVRATPDQYNDPAVRSTVEAVQQAQGTYKLWLEKSFREQLEGTRADWEATQPIAPNVAFSNQRWQRHVDQATAQMLGRVLPTDVLLAREAAGVIQLPADAARAAGFVPSQPPGPVADMTDTLWTPSDDKIIIVTGGGAISVLSSRGLLMVPAAPKAGTPAPPTTITVPGLRPSGPTGPTPASARPATPWIAAPAIGKSALVMVRTGNGPGVLVDAGVAQYFLPQRAISRMVTELGITSFDTILVTHPHADHVRMVLDLIKSQRIAATRFITSANWNQAGSGPLNKIIRALRGTTDQALIDLGYGPNWRPGIAIGTEGVTKATLRVAGGEVEIYARGEAHGEIRAAVRQSRAVPGHVLDSSSLLYVLGNPTSPHRVAVIGDLRGEDILALSAEMARTGGPGEFGRALTGVRVLIGFGHHMGLDAGNTPADIRGYELLFRETLLRTGELTIVVQSTREFALGTDPAQAAHGRALLEFATSMGARVVFAGEPNVPATGGGAVIGSDLTVRTQGTGVVIYEGDLPVRSALERLQTLREARRTVAASRRSAPTPGGQQPQVSQPEAAEIGPQQLRLTGTAAEIQSGLDNEIRRLEMLLDDLLGRKGADLLDARGQRVAASTRASFRAERSASGLTVDQIHGQLAQKGPIESSLQPEIVAGLRAAVRHGSTLAVEAELLATPRGVSDAIQRLPEGRRAALEQRYREMAEATKTLLGNEVPAGRRLEILHQVELLRAELRQLAMEVTADARPPIDAEIQRLTGVVDELMKNVESRTVTGRDAQGRVTSTEYRMEKPPDRVDKAFGRVGQVMGVMMVIHSVQGLAQTMAGAQAGQVNVPEAIFKTAYAVHSFSIGVRMVKLTPVGAGEFVALAMLEVGAIYSTDFKTSEERDYALATATVDQLCMAAGMAVMRGGAAIPHPVGKASVMGLGLAITLAGPRLLNFFGLDEWLVRETSFPPGEITHVYQRIDGVLNEYETILGAAALAARGEGELTALGAADPAKMREQAAEAKNRHTAAAREKEQELVGLFKDAYDVAAKSFTGLRALDAQAARFSRLRHAALPGDAAKAALEKQFLAMDPQAGFLKSATRQQIHDLPQWTKLGEKFDSLGDALTKPQVKWAKVFEEMDEAQQMIDNARYRVDPAVGGYRPAPMITPGTEAYSEYVVRLAEFERRLRGLLTRAAELGGSRVSPAGAGGSQATVPPAGDPLSALNLLQSLRKGYDDRVAQTAAELPALAAPDTWTNSFVLGQRLEEAHRTHPELFNRLRLTEMALQSAVGQARTAVMTVAGPRDPALDALIERETRSVEKAIENRKVVSGLVFPNEIDAELAARRTAEDRTLAARIDAAYPRNRITPVGDQVPIPLSEAEITALRSSELEKQGSRMTSTEHQLQRAWQLLGPVRAVSLQTGASLDYEKASRVERELVSFKSSSFWTYEKGWLDSADEHSVPAARTPIMARVGPDVLGRKGLFSGPTWYATVIAINPDAVVLLGSDPVLVTLWDIRPVGPGELAASAEQAIIPGTRQPGQGTQP